MAGTITSSRDNSGLAGGAKRDLVIQHNALVTDVETVRTQIAEYVGSATIDPGGLADGAGETHTITITGLALGDFVTAVSFDKDLQGITLTAYVCATDKVAVRLQNESGGSLDLASGTMRVMLASPGLADSADDLDASQIGVNGTAITA